MAKKIVATIGAGSRKLESKAGPRSFSGLGKYRLLITVSEGFVASTQKGPDFWVYRLRKLIPLGQPPLTCGIYLGGAPSYQYRQVNDVPAKVTQLNGTLLGQEIMWQNWSQNGRTTTEGIVSFPKEEGLSVHAFCSAATKEEVRTLRVMVETLRVKDIRK